MQRALNAQPANGCCQMTVPIKSDGLSCLPSYRSRGETRHTRVIQHANQERKCDVSESDEEDSCSCCRRSWRQRSRRQRQKHIELLILDHAAVGEDDVEPPTRSSSSSPQVSPKRSRSGSEESRPLLPSQASKRRKDKKDNKLADDEEEMMVAFLDANEMLWDKKAALYRRPDLKTTAWQKQAETMEEGSLSPAGLVQGHAWQLRTPGQAAQVWVWAAGFHRESCGRYKAYKYNYIVVVGYHPLLGRMQLVAASSSCLLHY